MTFMNFNRWLTDDLFDLAIDKKNKFDRLRNARLDIGLDLEEKKERITELRAVYNAARNRLKKACREAREEMWSEEAQ